MVANYSKRQSSQTRREDGKGGERKGTEGRGGERREEMRNGRWAVSGRERKRERGKESFPAHLRTRTDAPATLGTCINILAGISPTFCMSL
jgi:hypothetical protein